MQVDLSQPAHLPIWNCSNQLGSLVQILPVCFHPWLPLWEEAIDGALEKIKLQYGNLAVEARDHSWSMNASSTKRLTKDKQSPTDTEGEGDSLGCQSVSNVTHPGLINLWRASPRWCCIAMKGRTPHENEEHKWWFVNSVAQCGHHPTQPHPRSLLQPFQLMCGCSGDFNSQCDYVALCRPFLYLEQPSSLVKL